MAAMVADGWGAVHWRCRSRHARYAGHLGRNDAHVSRRDHGIPSARHIGTDAVDRNVFVAEMNPRQGFHFDVLKGGSLRLREGSYLFLGELNIVDHRFGNRIENCSISVWAEPIIFPIPLVEFRRHLVEGLVSLSGNLIDDIDNRS